MNWLIVLNELKGFIGLESGPGQLMWCLPLVTVFCLPTLAQVVTLATGAPPLAAGGPSALPGSLHICSSRTAAQPSLGPRKKSSFAVVQVSDKTNPHYIAGVLSAASRLRHLNSTADHVVVKHLDGELIDNETHSTWCWEHSVYRRAGVLVKPWNFTQIWTNAKSLPGQRWMEPFSKISVFGAMVGWDKVLFLDMDTYIHRSIDHVFKPSFGTPAMADWGINDYNSGALLLAPSLRTYEALLEYMLVQPRGVKTKEGVQEALKAEYLRRTPGLFLANDDALPAEDPLDLGRDPRTTLVGKTWSDQDFLVAFFTRPGSAIILHALPISMNFRSSNLIGDSGRVAHQALFRRDALRVVHFSLQKPWSFSPPFLATILNKTTGAPLSLSGYFWRRFAVSVADTFNMTHGRKWSTSRPGTGPGVVAVNALKSTVQALLGMWEKALHIKLLG